MKNSTSDIHQTKGVNGTASGPVSWAQIYSEATICVQQGDCLPGDTLIATIDGPVPIKDITEGTLVYGWNGKVSLFSAYRAYRTLKHAPVWTVTTDRGFAFSCTPDHGLLRRSSVGLPDNVEAKDAVGTPLMPFTRHSDRLHDGNDPAPTAHTVVSVEFSRCEDVYSIEVEGAHSFAVVNSENTTGVFVQSA